MKWSIMLTALMVVMLFAPVIVRLSEKHDLELFVRAASFTGYSWMGLLFLFVSCSLFVDMCRILFSSIDVILKINTHNFMPSAKFSFYLPFLFAVFASGYGYLEANNITTEHLIIRSEKIPPKMSGLKIVQISDVHIGLIVREEKLKKILKIVRDEEPDILVSTGDLVDGQINRLEGLAEMMKEINPRYGKYAITGNHEFYAGLNQALAFTEKSGFKILRGESIDINGVITIVGVDDRQGKTFGLFRGSTEKDLLQTVRRDRFTLLLKHRPELDEKTLGLFDLQLSGHTHKGQIFPFSIVTRLYYLRDSGYLKLADDSHLYVSRGTGTWGPPVRFLSPPEVTVIELLREE
jgi:predicted MPP superfamily phosphohydrolase